MGLAIHLYCASIGGNVSTVSRHADPASMFWNHDSNISKTKAIHDIVKCGDLGAALPKFGPPISRLGRIEIPARSKSQKYHRNTRAEVSSGCSTAPWKTPPKQPRPTRQDAEMRARGGNEPLVLEGDEGECLGLHLPRRRPPSASAVPPPPPSCSSAAAGTAARAVSAG